MGKRGVYPLVRWQALDLWVCWFTVPRPEGRGIGNAPRRGSLSYGVSVLSAGRHTLPVFPRAAALGL